MRLKGFVGVAAVAASLALGACSHAFRQPEVTLTGIRLGGLGARGGLIYADVAVHNPNGFALQADRVTYDFRVQDPSNPKNWVPFTAGQLNQRIKVGSGDTEQVEVPIQFDFATSAAAMRSIMDRGIMNYQVTGQVAVTEPITRNVPYQHEGVVSLAGAR